MKRLTELLENRGGSYVFPFFWQHGESEEVLRDYMRAIDEANIHAVCCECRPHPDFCGPQWWHDMDIILDEAVKRDMKVWILDDDHFPTGHCNGGISRAPLALRPQYLCVVTADCGGPSLANRFDILGAIRAQAEAFYQSAADQTHKTIFEETPEILSVVAFRSGRDGRPGAPVDLSSFVHDGVLTWDVPAGYWRIAVAYTTYNGDGRDDYMNILDHDSVRVLIDEVYEKHYEHYAPYFGKTILGFFSDEPPVGNIGGGGYNTAQIGGSLWLANPWSKALPALLRESLGEDWAMFLPLLWNEGEEALTARVRIAYMNAVTSEIAKNFSGQLGAWCKAHGVEYIGHVWEDQKLSYAFGGGLGHFFRAMDGNHMGGVDIIYHQMFPGADNHVYDRDERDFYYYVLGKLASSHAHIDPKKKGRALCESFGASGWDFGVTEMKYVTDNLLLSGINAFVPHAFSPKAFPDPDCPPHFYAHGENAQYRHFARLMLYMQRVCHLLNGGTHIAPAAVLYNAESQWVTELRSVKETEVCDRPAQVLSDAQIDYDLIPVDVLSSADLSGGVLHLNQETYRVLVVPGSEYTVKALAEFTARAEAAGFPVVFTERMPKVADERENFPVRGTVVPLAGLSELLREKELFEISVSPRTESLHYYHYRQESDLYFFVNNDLGKPFTGDVTVPSIGNAFLYDAYENVIRPLEKTEKDGKTVLHLTVKAYSPAIVIFGDAPAEAVPELRAEGTELLLKNFLLSSCAATAYPSFGAPVKLEKCENISVIHPEMMDFYRYETTFELKKCAEAVLSLDDVTGAAEVWCNGIYCGQRIAPDWIFDLSKAVKPGENALRIEVASTPYRKVRAMGELVPQSTNLIGLPLTEKPEGIAGEVRVFVR